MKFPLWMTRRIQIAHTPLVPSRFSTVTPLATDIVASKARGAKVTNEKTYIGSIEIWRNFFKDFKLLTWSSNTWWLIGLFGALNVMYLMMLILEKKLIIMQMAKMMETLRENPKLLHDTKGGDSSFNSSTFRFFRIIRQQYQDLNLT